MPTNVAEPIHLSERERRDLQALVRQQTSPQHLALRARIVLLADQGIGIRPSAEGLEVARTTVRNWRRRWLASKGARVAARLVDAPGCAGALQRRGRLRHYRFGLRGTARKQPGHPHWTQRELADEQRCPRRRAMRGSC